MPMLTLGSRGDIFWKVWICDHPGYLIERFAPMRFAKATFTTKTVNDGHWLQFSSINRLVEAGYEVHVNFSPIILYGGERFAGQLNLQRNPKGEQLLWCPDLQSVVRTASCVQSQSGESVLEAIRASRELFQKLRHSPDALIPAQL